MNQTDKVFLCRLDGFEESKGFDLTDKGLGKVFIVRRDGKLTAFTNACPHTGAPLEWKADQFLDFSGEFIQCSIHGAIFSTSTGECLRGPCVGASLENRELAVEAQSVFLVCKAD